MEQNQQQLERKRSRGDSPATTMEVDLAAAQAHAQWWPPELKPKLEANPSATVEGVDGATSAWVADECTCVSGQELPREVKDVHADLVRAGRQQELADWAKSDVISPRNACQAKKRIIQTRWVLTWKMMEGKKCVKARRVIEGFQDPDLKEG